jgi:hypothetical protein
MKGINMTEQSTPESEIQGQDIPYFGSCPECGKTDGYINIGGNHWFVCDKHKTKWCAGFNLFSCWKDESEEIWQANAVKLEGYKKVAPIRQ